MNTETYALELARRLTQAEAGSFHAHGDTVALDSSPSNAGTLQIIDAGSGRTEQTMQDDRYLRVRLHSPSMLIRLQDEPAPQHELRATTLRLGGAEGGVALALLSDPTREWKVGDLAAKGCVSLGAAQNTVVSLESEALLERSGKGPATRRRVTDPTALLDRASCRRAGGPRRRRGPHPGKPTIPQGQPAHHGGSQSRRTSSHHP